MRGLYVHIPFCVHKCDYCDFYSLSGQLERLEIYLQALLKEAASYGRRRFETIFIGGGTPSLMGAAGVRSLMHGLRGIYQFTRNPEVTIEANPDSVNESFLHAAMENGINRISIGIQSLSDRELQSVGRVHNSQQAMEAIHLVQKAGFVNVSADVILGLPGQTWPSLATTLETITGMSLPHLSLYCLTVEPHTALADKPGVEMPGDDEQAEYYQQAVSRLEQLGYRHYEISNFAQPGYECRHNLNYWRAGEYIGLGTAAASYYRGWRYKNKADLDKYLADPLGQKDEMECLAPEDKAAEEAMLRLRLLDEGLKMDDLIDKYGDKNALTVASRLNHLSQKGWLERNGSRFRLHAQDALVSNPILAELMGGDR
jgi:oxygen-independent coproporphyrinogen III oxidase